MKQLEKFALLCAFLYSIPLDLPATQSKIPVQASQAYGKVPLSFEPNLGQADQRVEFLAHGDGYGLFLTHKGAVLRLERGPNGAGVMMRLLHANPRSLVEGVDALPGKSNYFVGNDQTKWRTNIPTYSRVRYRDIYPGIDAVFSGRQRELEYDLVVAPGAGVGSIRLGFSGVRSIRIDENGDLVLRTGTGDVTQHRPIIYQNAAGERRFIAGRYVRKGRFEVAFEVAKYDRNLPLVIDPVVSYSTYLGGASGDSGNGIAVDASGQVYVTGSTGEGFPTTLGAYQTGPGTGDSLGTNVFVTKLNSAGSALIYSTYIGGSHQNNVGQAIAVDSSGQVYVTGQTESDSFPTTVGAYQTTFAGNSFSGNAFITKLNNTGSELLYSTYLGGNVGGYGTGIAIDSLGQAFVTGLTAGNFPITMGAYQTNFAGLGDAFVAKLNSTGTALVYSTYLGGAGDDRGTSIAIDASGQAYVTGNAGDGFPTTVGAYQTTFGGANSDVFVAKLNSNGSGLVYSTFIGDTGSEWGNGIAIDSAGQAYITGTTSTPFPTTTGAHQTSYGGDYDAFVVKLNSSGSGLVYSTLLGGKGQDQGYGIAVDATGAAYVTGSTTGNFPTTPGAYQPNYGGGMTDAFVAKLNNTGSELQYASYLGGTGQDYGIGIAADAAGQFYVTGNTAGNFLTTVGAYQNGYGGGYVDAFIVKFASADALSAPVLTSPSNGAAGVPTSQTLSWSAASGATSYDVYLSTSPSTAFVMNTASLNFTPALPLAAATTYYWGVVAKNGSIAYSSAIWSFTTHVPQVAVPNVVNMTQANAASTLTSVGLVLGTVTMGTSGSVPIGSVIGENPAAGVLANVGSTVNLLISGVANNRSFVSTTGNDASDCSVNAYCRTFSRAIAVTNPGGEIVVMNSGGYGPVTITQPVVITAIGVDASITQTMPGQNALTINTTGDVTITGLNLYGSGTGNDGVLVQAVGTLRLYNMQIQNFAMNGIEFAPTGSGNLVLYDSKINDCLSSGLFQGGGQAYVRNTGFDGNLIGASSGAGHMTIVDSSAHYNSSAFAVQGGKVELFSSRAAFNNIGLYAVNGTLSFADSLLSDNDYAYYIDVGGTGTMSGSSPGTNLITPGQSTSGTLSAPIVLP